MKVTVDSKKGLKTNLKVFVDKKTINDRMGERLIELSKTVNIKGFRPGKVPVDVLKRQFGKAIYGEVLEKVLKETSSKALEEKKIKVAGQPKLDLKSYGEGKDLNYTLEVDELPSIKIQSLESIKFNDYEINVSENEIKKRIEEIAKNQNNFKDKKDNEEAKEGDLVVFDYSAKIENKTFEGGEGKNTQIVLGKDLFIKGFDKQLIKAKKDETINVEVNLPENFPEKELTGKKAVFACKITAVKKPKEINIDDEFAKNLGAKDLIDLKKLISKQINDEFKNSLNALSKNQILKELEKFKVDEIPENLVEEEVKILTQGMKDDEIKNKKKEFEKTAKKRIKVGLILNEFGEKNNIKVEEHEIQAEVQKQLRMMPGQENIVREFYEKNPSALVSLRGNIYEEKIINLIKSKAKSNKKNITKDEAEKILKEANTHSHSHDHSHEESDQKKKQSKSKEDQVKKTKSTTLKSQKTKKVSKK